MYWANVCCTDLSLADGYADQKRSDLLCLVVYVIFNQRITEIVSKYVSHMMQ